MKQETKQCQSCQKDFVIEPEDFTFYEKIDVPPPTWCPECRLQRRLIWRNERALYERKCDFSGEKIISQYSDEVEFPVYDVHIFYSDKWTSPTLDYDHSQSFFEQFRRLYKLAPKSALLTDLESTKHHSIYQNSSSRNKNCYLIFASGDNEDCFYGASLDYCKECLDGLFVRNSELCYQCVDCSNCYRLDNSQDCLECSDSSFLLDCRNVSDSSYCVGLRNKSYCILNKQYSKKEYKEKLKEGNEFGREFLKLKNRFPRKFSRIEKSWNCSGDYIYNSKNIHQGFNIYQSENCKYCLKLIKAKDCHDFSDWGDPAELCYQCITVGKSAYRCKFSNNCWPECRDIEYSDSCSNCSNCFGCIGLRNKSYCILNKQYTKEEYFELKKKIIEKMKKDGEYGEFFPIELSPFCYNETIAQEYYPLDKEEALEKGFLWRDDQKRDYKISIQPNELPDHVSEVKDSITKEVIGCATLEKDRSKNTCTTAFKIIPRELEFYKKYNIPLPRYCPNCRHIHRISHRNPLKLHERTCMRKGCETEFETTYSPDRPEIVYCEKCYQQEVI